MALSQAQIIRSLAEALAWFEKELAWGVDPAELRHLTGRIGELYTAMITRGQMAVATNQRGYDVIGADNDRISVKTVTTSNHVTFRRSSFDQVDRVIVLRISIDEGEVAIEEVLDLPAAELPHLCRATATDLHYAVRPRRAPAGPLERLAIIGEASIDDYRIIQYETGTIVIDQRGVRQPAALPILRKIAADIGTDLLWSSGSPKNTRQLGADVIAALVSRLHPRVANRS